MTTRDGGAGFLCAKSSQLPRYDYDEIIDALEGEEDDAADSDAGEDYELVG